MHSVCIQLCLGLLRKPFFKKILPNPRVDANLISLRQQATITAEDSAGSKERKMGMELGKRKKKRENGKEVGQDERGCDQLTWCGDVKLAGKRPLDRLFGFTRTLSNTSNTLADLKHDSSWLYESYVVCSILLSNAELVQ